MALNIGVNFYKEHLQHVLPESSLVHKKVPKYRMDDDDNDSTFSVPYPMMDYSELELIYSVAQEQGNRSVMISISKVKKVIDNIAVEPVKSLDALESGLVFYLTTNAIDGWLYKRVADTTYDAYLVTDIRQIAASSYKSEKPSVQITLEANGKGSHKVEGKTETSIYFDSDDLGDKTVGELLAARKFYHETPALRARYNVALDRFVEYRKMYKDQFVVTGVYMEDEEDKLSGEEMRVVNDNILARNVFVSKTETPFWEKLDVNHFTNVPTHTYLFCFSLLYHKHIWVYSTDMTPYVYDEKLYEKLILPEEHKDLIDILVSDLGVLQEDIVKGKTGGTTILCSGSPGLGKTLTAEVYSEAIRKPLYRVHSGQLGVNVSKLEEVLTTILKRAQRWGAVLLIDEADVYIRERGTDMTQNAVVATFLRTLEYFNGLLFLTTNRQKDVDDAILSRCIAVIRYGAPNKENATKIWKVLSSQYNVALSDDLIDQLTEKYPFASGRDIKELLKLVTRWLDKKKEPLSMEVFRKCAQFRGLDMTKETK